MANDRHDPISQANLERIGMNIRLARVEQRLPQDHVAREAGTNRGHLSAIELGSINASSITICRIAKALGVPPGRLFDGIE